MSDHIEPELDPTHSPHPSLARRVLIVGGVAGGASCAARLRRLDESVEIAVFDRGPYVAFANCGLPYYVGDVITDERTLLVSSPEMFRERFNIEVHTNTDVIGIDRPAHTISVRDQRQIRRRAHAERDQSAALADARPLRRAADESGHLDLLRCGPAGVLRHPVPGAARVSITESVWRVHDVSGTQGRRPLPASKWSLDISQGQNRHE